MSYSANHDLTLRDREQGGDVLSDAAGMIAYAAKAQGSLFSELRVDEETIAEVEGDTVWLEMPRVRVGIPLRMAKNADQVAGWAADSAYTFYKAMFEDLRS